MSSFRFRKRQTTDAICVVCRNINGLTKDKLFRESRRLGELDTGYHIILSNCGLEETDRDIYAVANSNLPEYETSIYVLADSPDKNINDAQRLALNRMSIRYNLPYKIVEV